ncbi:ABC transporter permease [Diplocloster agilis]|uniref:ABC transporter permease n=1 Tax=Diplocloster agilis TaxID=2850323 RepID=UPI000821B045|nr:ABC transporter permease subunit [Suonthocola fibrivorans]MCU6733273.1 ABC transporter permease subunit [Suonthocola fibrivorans]SCI83475.1 sn-glycerol-3-phosphate transport system permease protein ugpA [uncultured Clostridium sp.]
MNSSGRWKAIKKHKALYWFLVPAVISAFIFNYLPMIGVIMSFQDYNPVQGFFGSPFVGLKHFQDFFSNPDFYRALSNTLGINFLMIVIGFPMPIIFALMLNELRTGPFKRVTQTITYLPHFLSWVVVAGIAYRLFSQDTGVVNMLISLFGREKVAFFRESRYFWGLLVGISIWKDLGWNSIIYLAALAGVDGNLYEAAMIDGAGRWKRLLYVTLPCIAPTIGIMLVLQIGALVSSTGSGSWAVSFDAVFNLQNALVAEKSTTLDIFVYQQGIQYNRVSLAAAVGLVQSVVSLILVVFANKLSKRLSGNGVL